MIGILKIFTPAIRHQMDLETLDANEVYAGSMKLKQWVCLEPGMPFIVYLEIPSKMNVMEFEVDDDVPIENLALAY